MKATIKLDAADFQQEMAEKLIKMDKEGDDVSETEHWEVIDEEGIKQKEASEDTDKLMQEEMDGQNFKEEDKEKDSKLSGAWPIWPVGLNDMRKTPLNYTKKPLPTYTAADFARRGHRQDGHSNQNESIHIRFAKPQTLENGINDGKDDGNCVRFRKKYLPSLTAYKSNTAHPGESKHLKFTNPETKCFEEMCHFHVGLLPAKQLTRVDYVRLPMISEKTSAVLSQNTQEGKKYCTTEMLGVRFKTDAHERVFPTRSLVRCSLGLVADKTACTTDTIKFTVTSFQI
ncbi:uncharacterized protein [Montipora capricornis]|uniref:uncharacterized protein n=1 Tax=Montipora capricornis TaxID=246305 RepID=UPI0035F125AA